MTCLLALWDTNKETSPFTACSLHVSVRQKERQLLWSYRLVSHTKLIFISRSFHLLIKQHGKFNSSPLFSLPWHYPLHTTKQTYTPVIKAPHHNVNFKPLLRVCYASSGIRYRTHRFNVTHVLFHSFPFALIIWLIVVCCLLHTFSFAVPLGLRTTCAFRPLLFVLWNEQDN